MRLQRIEQFIAVVDAGSIRGAARRLGVSQPALTRGLQQLEEDLGVQLMQRSVRGAVLTHAGSAFLARARVAETELRKGADEARRSVHAGGETVSLGVSSTASSLLLPEFATTMLQKRPGVQLRLSEVSPSAVWPLVREAALDLAVAHRTHDNLDAGLRYRPLFEIQMRVAARPGHPLAGAPRTLHELARGEWLSLAAPGPSTNFLARSFMAEGLSDPVPAVHCNSYSVALELVASTDLLAVLPPAKLRACIAQGLLVEVPLAKPFVPLHVGLYTRADTPATAATRAAAQVIVAIARRTTATGDLRSTEPIRVTPPASSGSPRFQGRVTEARLTGEAA
jgi:DNA-binding transcriptional LysR family regulator